MPRRHTNQMHFLFVPLQRTTDHGQLTTNNGLRTKAVLDGYVKVAFKETVLHNTVFFKFTLSMGFGGGLMGSGRQNRLILF